MSIITKEDDRFAVIRKLHADLVAAWVERGAAFSAWWERTSVDDRKKFLITVSPDLTPTPIDDAVLYELNLEHLSLNVDDEGSLVELLSAWGLSHFDFKLEEENEAVGDEASFFENQFEIAADVWDDVGFKSQYNNKTYFSTPPLDILSGLGATDKVDNNFIHINKMNPKINTCIEEGIFLDARVADLMITRATQLLTFACAAMAEASKLDVSKLSADLLEKYKVASRARPVGGCEICGKKVAANGEPLLKCARCRTAAYCSKECQKQHWPTHKTSCVAAKTQ